MMWQMPHHDVKMPTSAERIGFGSREGCSGYRLNDNLQTSGKAARASASAVQLIPAWHRAPERPPPILSLSADTFVGVTSFPCSQLPNLVCQRPNDLRVVACSCRRARKERSAANHPAPVRGALGRPPRRRASLIAEGFAVAFQCGNTSCPPMPRPWCRWRRHRMRPQVSQP
jgi:hypothetical protein